MIERAKYLEGGIIEATIDGVTVFVPDDPTNRHRQMLAEWEKKNGNVILPYIAPIIDLSLLDQETLNNAHIQDGSVVRAPGLTLFDAINAQNLVVLDTVNELRVIAGKPVYTVAQFRSALIAKQGKPFYTLDEFTATLKAKMR